MRLAASVPLLGALLLLGAALLGGRLAEASILRPERLPRDDALIDFILRVSDDPDLLSARQARLRQHLLDMGIRPRGGWDAPSTRRLIERRFATGADWYPEVGARQVEILEVDWEHRNVMVFRFPESTLFFTDVDTNLVGIAFEAPRDMADSTLAIQLDSVDSWLRHWGSIGLNDKWRGQVRGRQAQARQGGDLLNFTIPIKLPRTLERIIGRGDATNIRISGTETISIGGTSTVRSDFVPNEIQQSQSLFPTLEMQQSLRVNLDGTVGEKIKVRVSHDSERVGAESTEVKLSFEGDEDDIIQTIRAGNIDVTLPGSRLLGVGASKGGLFGVKVEGAMGPVEFTLLTSKEQSQANEQSFSQQGGVEDEFVIPSTDYAKARFFRVSAPFSFFFPSDIDPLGALHDDSLVPFLPVQNGGLGWRIDISTLEIFLAIGPGLSDENTVDAGVAFLDETGIGWESVQGSTADLDSTALRQLFVDGRVVRRERWRRLVPNSDWVPLYGGNEELIGVAMSRGYTENEALACAYNILDPDGNVVRRVGRILNDAAGPTIPDLDPNPATNSGGEIYFFKLLKPASAPDPVLDDGSFHALALTWEYEFRNFYDLRGREIDPSTFELTIERNDTALDLPHIVPDTDPSLRWIRVFGLDQLDQSGNQGSDDEADITNAQIFRLDSGFMQFPSATPFDPAPETVQGFTDGALDSLSSTIRAPALYRRRLVGPESNDLAYFNLVVRQSSVSSRLRLNAFNIKEGSEEVILDGRVLQRNVDYTIDYFGGEVNLQGEALGALNAQSNIQVRYEVDPLFGGGRTSLNGFNLTYRLGQQNNVSTTWLLQSQPNNATKPRLGEEPSKNWVGNVSAKLKFEPGWLRSMANLLPLVDSSQEATTNLDAEVAVSMPNPNTRNEAYVEDFESVDQSNNINLSRDGWWWASLPAEYTEADDQRVYQPKDRTYTGWHRPVPGVKRGDLNPTLSEQERRDVLPALELRVVSSQPEMGWMENEFGGIMRSLGEIDLTQAQFLEFWLDDGTGFVPTDQLAAGRPGRLHFDFGFINEDFFWKKNAQGDYVTGRWDNEDQDNDGQLSVATGEDAGLDNLPSDEETSNDVLIPGRPTSASDPAGDDYDADPGEGNVFVGINGTEDNQRLDSEDLDRDNFHDLQDGYFTLTLELSDLERAIVDIYRDYADNPAFIDDATNRGLSWRKYRLDLRDLQTRVAALADSLPYTDATPDLSRVRYLRIWYEAPANDLADRRIKFAEMRFLGNRWLNDQVRGPDDEVIPLAERGTQEFRLGVVNNKENPEYVPPVFPDTRNNVAEKEQSLQFLYTDLEPGNRVRARKDIPGRGGQDYLTYGELNFFWRIPFQDGMELIEQRALEGYFWVGTDSLNYYEIAVPFSDVVPTSDGWQECRIDLGEMTQVKDDPDSVRFAVPGDSTSARIRVRNLTDTLTGEVYRVEVRGKPDLRRVQRFYAGVRYPSDDPGNDARPPFTGEVLFNEIRLKEVNDKKGFAQRYALNTSVPGLGDLQVDWSQTDEEFRGLNRDAGSGVLQRSWSARASSNLKNLVPTFGLDVPFSLSQRERLDLPKYRSLSDVELNADNQEAEKTFEIARSFNFQVRKSEPSQNAILQYTVDRFSMSWSGTRSERIGPTRDASQESADRKFNYDLRIRQGFGIKLPWMREELRLVPNQITVASTWRWDQQSAVEKQRTQDGDIVVIPREPKTTKTNVNNATLTFQPLRSMRGSFALSSNRNLLLDQPADSTKPVSDSNPIQKTEFLGLFQIGKEEVFQQRVNFAWKSDLRFLRWLKPDFEYNSAYQENRRPGIRQRASRADESITGDGFLGRPGEVRHLSTNGDISVRAQVDLTGWLKKRFGEERRRPQQDPDELRRQQQRERGSISRRRADDEPPATTPTSPTPVPGTAPADTTVVGEESLEEDVVQEVDDPFGEQIGEVPPASGEEPTTSDEDAERRRQLEEAERQRAERQQEAERLRREQETGAEEGEEPVEGEQEGEQEGDQEFAPGEAVGKLFAPFKNLVLNLQPINSSWQRQMQTNYQHVNGRADLLYRFGLVSRPDEGAIGRVPLASGDTVTEPWSNESRQWTDRYTFSTQSQITETIRFDTNFAYRKIQREGSRGDSEDRTLDFPNVNLRISRVHEWRVFGDLFTTSNLDFNFKRSRSVQNAVAGQEEFPKVSYTFQPRWTFRFENGLDTNLNVTWNRDTSENSINQIRNNQIRGNVKLQKNFDAEGALSFLRFGRRGTGTTIDMNVDISYTRQRSERFNKTTERSDQQRGTDRFSVLPNFSYQFSRNLRAGLRLEYSRSKDVARDATTTTFGLGLDATLNF